VAVCLQVSLNAEEGLYWYHLMTAVRKPRSSKSWLNSSFFIAWIVISIFTFVIPHCVIYIGVKSEVERAGKMYTVLGALELLWVSKRAPDTLADVQRRFDSFDRLVQISKVSRGCGKSLTSERVADDQRRSGASREVRSRLYFYHGKSLIYPTCSHLIY